MRTTLSLLAALLLAAPALAQDAPPPAKSVLVTVGTRGEDGKRITLERIDLESGAREVLPCDMKAPFIVDLSPSRKRALVSSPKSDELWLFEVSPWKRVEGFEVKGDAFAKFLSEDRILVLNEVRDPNTGGSRTDLLTLKDDGSARAVVASFEGSYWDDVPLRVSPKQTWATFHSNETPRGQRLVDLKTGAVMTLPVYASFVTFSADESTLTLYGKGVHESGHIKDGAYVKDKELSEDELLEGVLEGGARVLLQLKEGGSKLLLARGETETTLSETPGIDDGVLHLVDRIGERITWIDRPESKSWRVQSARLTKDGLEGTKTLVKAPFLSGPYLIP